MKKTTSLILILIILSTVLGYNLYTTKKNYKNANQLAFYNYCNSLSFIFKDLNDEIFEAGKENEINSQYMKQSIAKNIDRFVSVEQMISQLSESDARIKKVYSKGKFALISNYFMTLGEVSRTNNSLDNEDINILHQILDKAKMFGIYGESSKNYKEELDPEHNPLDKIITLCQDMGNLCNEGYERLKGKR
ncbi:MAG TPA: hypothetical protein DEF85_03215 [Clostridiaceae bacterium]|jgi:hypothetical protein|nr:hypothetical protein [Clostridiaceae bacterium]HBF78036.1 hypothetical protein [Clostridiaceae bacterium]HBG38993.1 hypothetical protein [Clostridiaceae bacterium]HBN28430.1 hypothetical protein [Clostridiaceae bacterium]HBX47882.1 hypothetical protein [Clostridiaceae bacterium]